MFYCFFLFLFLFFLFFAIHGNCENNYSMLAVVVLVGLCQFSVCLVVSVLCGCVDIPLLSIWPVSGKFCLVFRVSVE